MGWDEWLATVDEILLTTRSTMCTREYF